MLSRSFGTDTKTGKDRKHPVTTWGRGAGLYPLNPRTVHLKNKKKKQCSKNNGERAILHK